MAERWNELRTLFTAFVDSVPRSSTQSILQCVALLKLLWALGANTTDPFYRSARESRIDICTCYSSDLARCKEKTKYTPFACLPTSNRAWTIFFRHLSKNILTFQNPCLITLNDVLSTGAQRGAAVKIKIADQSLSISPCRFSWNW